MCTCHTCRKGNNNMRVRLHGESRDSPTAKMSFLVWIFHEGKKGSEEAWKGILYKYYIRESLLSAGLHLHFARREERMYAHASPSICRAMVLWTLKKDMELFIKRRGEQINVLTRSPQSCVEDDPENSPRFHKAGLIRSSNGCAEARWRSSVSWTGALLLDGGHYFSSSWPRWK